MNRFFAFFVVSLLIHVIVGAVLISRSGIFGGKGEEEAVEVNPVEEIEEPNVEPVEKPVVKPKKVRKPPQPRKEKKKVSPKIEKKPVPKVKKVKLKKPVETPPPKVESVDKKSETQEEEPQDESEVIEPKKEETSLPPAESVDKKSETQEEEPQDESEFIEPKKEETPPPKVESVDKKLETQEEEPQDESEVIEPKKEEVKPEEKKEEAPSPKPLDSGRKKLSPLKIKQARSHSQLKQIKGNPLPVYPAEALKKKWEGRVEVIYYVNPGGFVEQIQLKQSSGHSALDNSALRALSRYRYHPGQEGWVQHPVEFFLEKGKEIKEMAPLGVPESE